MDAILSNNVVVNENVIHFQIEDIIEDSFFAPIISKYLLAEHNKVRRTDLTDFSIKINSPFGEDASSFLPKYAPLFSFDATICYKCNDNIQQITFPVDTIPYFMFMDIIDAVNRGFVKEDEYEEPAI